MAEYEKDEKDEKKKRSKKETEEFLDEWEKKLEDAIDREATERIKKKKDLDFVVLDQWDAEIRKSREGDPNGPRPCLTIDKIGQYRMQIINEIRKNRPAIKVRPVDDGGDPETAEVLQGLTRHIEDYSGASLAYQVGAEWAIDTGDGYFRILTDYSDEKSFNQQIKIAPIFDAFSVYLGPHLMPDGSDSEYAMILDDIPESQFKRDYPGKKVPLPDEESPFWVGKDHVRVVEIFYYEWEKKTLLSLSDGNSAYADEYDGPQENIIDSRETVCREVCWVKRTKAEIIDERDWAGSYIPVIRVTGHQKIVDGKKRTWGIIRPAIDAARMYNYISSAIAEKSALAPKAPFIGYKGQFDDPKWKDANRKNYPYLEAEMMEVGGNVVPLPRRQEPIPVEPGLVQQLPVLEHDIQTSLGMFKASVGETQGDQSGRAIRALQGQSDTATFHFPDNLAQSIMYCGRQLIDLIPKIMDTAQVVRIIGIDDKPKSVQIDPNQQQPVTKQRFIDTNTGQQGVKSIYNLGVGKYDVTVTVGPSYATKRMEALDVMQETIKTAPQLLGVIGDLMFKAMDTPYADQIAERLKPGGDNPQAKLQQMGQQMQQMQQAMQKLGQENQQLKSGAQVDAAKVQSDSQNKQAELQMKAQMQQQELVLKAQIQEKELEIERQKAEAEINLAAAKADAEIKIKAAQLNADIQSKTLDNQFKLNEQNTKEASTAMPQFLKALDGLTQHLGKMHESHGKMVEEMVKAGSRDRVSEVVMPDGRKIRAVSKAH